VCPVRLSSPSVSGARPATKTGHRKSQNVPCQRDCESSDAVDTVGVVRFSAVTRRVLLGLTIATGLVTSAAVDLVGSAGEVSAGAATATCSAPTGTTDFTLTDVAPGVRLNLALGSIVIVRTSKWPGGRATKIANSNRTVLHEICSTLTSDGGREAVYAAHRLGRSLLWATVAPADTFMPSWSGIVTVTAASNAHLSMASSRHWKVTLSVARTSTKVGTTISALVTVDNRTDHRVEISGCPGTTYEILLGNAKVPNTPVSSLVLCVSWIDPGVHVFRSKVQTKYQMCNAATGPKCGNPPRIPPLPVGKYHTQLVLPSSAVQLPMPKPISITLTS